MKLRNGIISPANSGGCEYQYVMHGLSFDVWFIQHMCKLAFHTRLTSWEVRYVVKEQKY
jgi:hypothetical protein